MSDDVTSESISVLMAKVMGDVQKIGKGDRTNNTRGENYSFRGVDATVNAIGPALRAHGVVVVPHKVKKLTTERYETRSGAHMMGAIIRLHWRFYGPAGDFINAESLGQASDAGDKAVPKAHSVAYRTLLLEAFSVPTGDADPDTENHERQQEEPPPIDLEPHLTLIDQSSKAAELARAGAGFARLNMPDDQRQILRDAYTARKKELEPKP